MAEVVAPEAQAQAAIRRGRVILVTGGSTSPGVTSVALHLAVAVATMGRNTILADCDPDGGFIAHWLKVLALRMLQVQYEDLVADLEGQSRRIISFLGLPWNPAAERGMSPKGSASQACFISTGRSFWADEPLSGRRMARQASKNGMAR